MPNKPAAASNVSARTVSSSKPATTKSGTVPRRIVSSRASMGLSLCRQNTARITNVTARPRLRPQGNSRAITASRNAAQRMRAASPPSAANARRAAAKVAARFMRGYRDALEVNPDRVAVSVTWIGKRPLARAQNAVTWAVQDLP